MSQTTQHRQHITSRVSHSNCSECRADTERRFVDISTWRYQHVAYYLAWAKPRLAAIHKGNEWSVDARIWHRKFREALHRRITLKAALPIARRKYCDSYLERCRQFPRATDVEYLKRFARRGASCLD